MSLVDVEPREPRSGTLLLHCPLRLGLAASLTRFVYEHGGRILYHEQYVDPEIQHYYTRLRWDVSGFTQPDAEIASSLDVLIGDGPDVAWSLHPSDAVSRWSVRRAIREGVLARAVWSHIRHKIIVHKGRTVVFD